MAANKIVPVSRENWIHQSNLSFEFYAMLGIPSHVIERASGALTFSVAMAGVEKITKAEAGPPPKGVLEPSEDWFIGRIGSKDPFDIEGMSGGPIYGFRSANGELFYHAVAVQSRWWGEPSRVILGCSIPLFAEIVWNDLQPFVEQITEQIDSFN